MSFTGAANSDTTPNFTVLGGKYALTVHSSGTASATLQQLMPDGSFVAIGSAVTAAQVFDLPAGTYNIVMGASAGTQAGALIRIPYRRA